VNIWRPLRHLLRIKAKGVLEVELRGAEYLKGPVEDRCGVLITPNHAAHADPFVVYEAADELGRPFYFMAAWQVFGRLGMVERIMLRQHGVFSVDREGTDMQAFRQAVSILQESSNPLVIFPEGEVYHINDRVTPFREGPAVIAMTAAKRAIRPVVCVPCAIKYIYVQDPTPQLIELMSQLEERILWRPRPDIPLAERIYRFAEAALALKEQEYLGHTQQSALPERISSLSHKVLEGLEGRYEIRPSGETTLPERVKALRKEVIERFEPAAEDSELSRQGRLDLDDLFLVTQLFSYPGDYVAGKPTIERMAETLDKFEEDVLRATTATIRGARRAVVSFGEPIELKHSRDRKKAAHTLTEILEDRVQKLLDNIRPANI